MQSIYSLHQNGSDNLAKEEKFLLQSIDHILDLYLIMISALIEIRKMEEELIEKAKNKHLSTEQERNPNLKFIHNKALLQLENSRWVEEAIDDRNINIWKMNDDYIIILHKAVKESKLFQEYMADKKSDFESDRFFLFQLFTDVIVPNEKLYDYLEDYRLTWVDDIPVVNTQIQRQLKTMEEGQPFRVPSLYKDEEDKDFAVQLLRKTLLNEDTLAKEYIDKTPNWDSERIAEIDTIILKMAICEFLRFPSIPVKVTINEYLEIAKEYSTSKSSIFINGILDNLVKEYQTSDKLKKTGRGLM